MVGSPVFTPLTPRTTHSSDFTLTCPSTSFPPVFTTWLRDGQPVAPGGGQQFQSWQVMADALTTSYNNILRVNGSLAGEYQCRLGNSQGNASASLMVRGEPTSYIRSTLTFRMDRDVCLAKFHCKLHKAHNCVCNSNHYCQILQMSPNFQFTRYMNCCVYCMYQYSNKERLYSQ